jgi:hypothetical protein
VYAHLAEGDYQKAIVGGETNAATDRGEWQLTE